MLEQNPGKIFLADQRGELATAQFRRDSTFCFGPYVAEHKQAFGSLHGLNEETLAGGQRVAVEATQASQVLIIPITGEVWVEPAASVPVLVSVEEMYVATVPAGTPLHFANPYATELVSFLHIWLTASPPAETTANRLFTFNLQDAPNSLVAVQELALTKGAGYVALPFRVSLGQFDGRCEAEYRLQRDAAGCFVFVLAGAFEVNGRLLHPKDGLALWATQQVDVEALSNDAVLLLLELEN